MAFGDLSHVFVDRNKDRVAADSNLAHKNVRRPSGEGLLKKGDVMTLLLEEGAYGFRRSLIEEQREDSLGRQATLSSARAVSTSVGVRDGYSAIICSAV